MRGIQGDESTKELILDLIVERVNNISIDETPALRCMSVEVEVHSKLSLSSIVVDYRL
jgi:hypothetical protein